MTEYAVGIRMADQADIDALGANASVGESAAIDIGGKLAAVLDEYGTATVHRDANIDQEAAERLGQAMTDIWPLVSDYNPRQMGGRVLIARGQARESLRVCGVYNHEPNEEDIHFAVIDLLDPLGALPQKRQPPYFTRADLPEGIELIVLQVGEPRVA